MPALLHTKLYGPPTRPGQVSRQRLLNRLNAGLWLSNEPGRRGFARKLTLVSAPAGFGKTTLVAEWVMAQGITDHPPHPASDHHHAAWLSLDEVDSDPARFFAYFIAALQITLPDIGQEAQVVLQSETLPAVDEALILLVNDVAVVREPMILVLDDYHLIRSEVIDQLLTTWLERQPPNFHLVIAGRADPSLPLSRLRAQHQMLELRASDLRFVEAEVAAFLNLTMGLDLSPGAMSALAQHTEGWIAGLQLAALSLQELDDKEAFIEAFSGSNRYIIDYLVDEVLSYQTPDVRDFLVQTSILDWLCAPLCDALVQASDEATPLADGDASSQAVLDYLERSNLFLLPMDDQRRWYRYHHLFADSLRNQLERSQQAELHQRAARWYADNGDIARAVHHALAAPDHELTAELLGEAGREATLLASGDFRRYAEWVEMLPEAVRREHPRLQLIYARALQITGQLARAETILSEVERALQAAPVVNEELLAVAAMYQSQCLLERGELARAVDLAHGAVDRLSTSTPLNHARALSSLACVEYGLGNFAAATPRFITVSRMPGSPSLAMNAAECAARGLLLQGKLKAAQQLAELFLASVRTGATYNHMAAGAMATLSEVAYHQGALDSIPRYGDQAIDLAQRMARQAPLRAHEIWVYLQYARLRRLQGDGAGVAEALALADQVALEIDNAFYRQLAQLRRKAFDLAREHDIVQLSRIYAYPPVAFSYLKEYRGWIDTQVCLAQHRPQEALPIIDELLKKAELDERGLSVIELQLWRALTLHALRKPAAASAALAQAVAWAAPEGCLRLFVDAGGALPHLLPSVRTVAPDFVRTLILALSEEGTPSRAKGQPSEPQVPAKAQELSLTLQLEALTEREIEILRLLADGLSNQDIGRKLFIGVGTVKWYLTHLYSKLGVASRTQAVARAREIGIVS